MIAAPVQCNVDGIPKGSHYARVPPMGPGHGRDIALKKPRHLSLKITANAARFVQNRSFAQPAVRTNTASRKTRDFAGESVYWACTLAESQWLAPRERMALFNNSDDPRQLREGR
jgi:hypothetical protein